MSFSKTTKRIFIVSLISIVILVFIGCIVTYIKNQPGENKSEAVNSIETIINTESAEVKVDEFIYGTWVVNNFLGFDAITKDDAEWPDGEKIVGKTVIIGNELFSTKDFGDEYDKYAVEIENPSYRIGEVLTGEAFSLRVSQSTADQSISKLSNEAITLINALSSDTQISGPALYMIDNNRLLISLNCDYFELERLPMGTVAASGIETLIAPTFEFDNVLSFSGDGFANVVKDGKWGVVNADGKLVLETVYEYTPGEVYEGFFNGLTVVMQNGKYGFVNEEGNIVIPLAYDYCSNFKNGFADVRKDGKYGVIDTNGTVLVPIEYQSLSLLPTSLAIAAKDVKCGVIDMTGNEVVPFIYDNISALPFDSNYYNHLFAIWQNGKAALADIDGNPLTDFVYEHIDFFSEERALVRKEDGKWGYIDKNGVEIIPAVYEKASQFYHGLASVTEDGVDSFIDTTGTVSFVGNALGFYDSYNLALRSDDNGKWGAIDRTGKLVVPIEYDDINIYDEVLIWVNDRTEQRSGYYDKDGNIVVPLRQNSTGKGSKPAEGLIGIEKDNKCGYVDYAGNSVVEFEYDAVGEFNGGFAPVQKDDVWGYIDKSGQYVVMPEYDQAQSFSNGWAWVQKDGKWGILRIIQ